MATVDSAIDEVITELRKVSALRKVPDNPPEAIELYPFATCVARSGNITGQSDGFLIGLHDIEIHVHVQRMQGGLSKAYDDIIPLVSSIPKQLLSSLKGGNFSALTTWEDISYEFAPSSWNEVETLAYIFTMESCKVLDTYT